MRRIPAFFFLTCALCTAEPPPETLTDRDEQQRQFAKLDANGDGTLSREEIASVRQYLTGADADGDGKLTIEEIREHFRIQAARRVREAVPDAANGAQRFRELDHNADGKLSGQELRQGRWLLFLDKDGDGAVTLAEARLALAKTGSPVDPGPSSAAEPPPAFTPPDSPRQAPRPLRPADGGIGRRISDCTLTDLDGKTHALAGLCGKKATVIALVSPSCPVGKRYTPELVRMEKARGAAEGIAYVFIAPNKEDTAAALKACGFSSPVLRDESHVLLRDLGARVSTDVFVLDAARTLCYRGAIDDRYGLGYSRETARVRYLEDALAAVVAGRPVDVSATEAPGCDLTPEALAAPAAPTGAAATYHGEISRIFQAHCVECHRAGGIAPFALETLGQVEAKSGMIRRMVGSGLMPPWFAAPAPSGAHSPWINDRSLPEREKNLLLGWLASGRPAGNAKDAPAPRTWPTEWQIGPPDAVFQIPQPIAVKAEGTMPYQNVLVKTGTASDQWVRGWEVKPTAREVVHHVLVFLEKPGRGAGGGGGGRRSRISDDEEGGGFFAAFVPGNSSVIYPDGFGKLLPAGAVLRFQIHYTPSGAATKDQVKIGFLFTNKAPEHVVEVAGIANPKIRIPAGAPDHAESASIPVPVEVRLLGFMPHMHLRGKAFRYEVVLPHGETRLLLDVPRYDFNWQLAYRYAEPPSIPAGSKIRCTGWYDNSPHNPANPDPARIVTWGPQTQDEMMLGYVEYYRASAAPPKQG
jgi:mono/diheme cytochrome c family protein